LLVGQRGYDETATISPFEMNPTLKTPLTGAPLHDRSERNTPRAAASLFRLPSPVNRYPAGGCWCAEEAARLPLPVDGADRLCRDCLRKAAET
jgi:hypothetical protein